MRTKKSLISWLLCIALVLASLSGLMITPVSAADTKAAPTSAQTSVASTGSGNTKYSSEEVILQCWNWPVSVIRSYLNDIADAGFTAIQTSTINGIVGSGNSTADNTVENWYQFYQPINYSIGNKICTQAEFTTLCNEAHELGLKVIVDVALNHTSDYTAAVSSSLKNYHGNGEISNWDDRWQQTQKDITGMPDLKTEDSSIQSQARTLLSDILAAGADGFRFDAAKHIELPSGDEISGCPTSDFWPNVLNNLGDKFSYGEVLAGQNCPLTGYAKYMNISGSAYSDAVRSDISNNVLNASNLSDYKAGLGGSNLVCWVESHDNYKGGNYAMPKYQIVRGYAAIAAQGLNAMYMARPYGSTTSNWKGSNNTYDGGNGDYFDDEVVGVNKFHNICKGAGVNTYNYNNNNQILVVQRGNKGVCIINTGSSTVNVTAYNLSGTYKDYTHNKTYTANSSGQITVSVAPGVYPIAQSTASSSDVQLSDCYLHGWINGADYTGTDYRFNASGSLAATFANDSYVYIHANGTNYNTVSYVDGTSGTFYTGYAEKMKVPAGTHTFTLSKSGTGFSLSYTNSGGGTVTEPTTPTTPTTPTENAIYLSVPDTYEVSTPDWYIWTWGDKDGRAVKGVKDAASGYYKFTDYDTNAIFLRMSPASSFSWDNEWNRVQTTVGSGKNLFTITGWELSGSWSTYTPAPTTYDYTIVYNYTVSGTQKTLTKTLNGSTETDAYTIAAANAPVLGNSYADYVVVATGVSKSGTTITANLYEQKKSYEVTLNGTTVGSYSYLDTATVTNPTATGFLIDGKVVKIGTSFSVYVTGDIDITTDATAKHEDVCFTNLNGTFITDSQISFEVLATANIDNFARMGVVMSATARSKSDITNAVKAVTTGTGTSNKIIVHNSSVNQPNQSGQYQFVYAPYASVNKVPSNLTTLYFYTYAVNTDGDVTVSAATYKTMSEILS